MVGAPLPSPGNQGHAQPFATSAIGNFQENNSGKYASPPPPQPQAPLYATLSTILLPYNGLQAATPYPVCPSSSFPNPTPLETTNPSPSLNFPPNRYNTYPPSNTGPTPYPFLQSVPAYPPPQSSSSAAAAAGYPPPPPGYPPHPPPGAPIGYPPSGMYFKLFNCSYKFLRKFFLFSSFIN